jgi:L-fucose mutarotase/ribose pyranase (RbsD/FucU family)
MKKFIKLILPIFVVATILSCQPQNCKPQKTDWKTELNQTIKDFGHRNWIVVADAAYPKQSNPAIKTVCIDATQLEAVEYVKSLVEKQKHIRANIYLDNEINYVPEADAKGIDNYKKSLNKILINSNKNFLPHEDIIHKLDKAGQLVNVLILKTDLCIPYTSVFFELDCGYWGADAEKRMRENIEKMKK